MSAHTFLLKNAETRKLKKSWDNIEITYLEKLSPMEKARVLTVGWRMFWSEICSLKEINPEK